MKKNISVEEMAKFKIHSEEWFKAAFENCIARKSVINASKRICLAYGISGQADPAYIANVIESELSI